MTVTAAVAEREEIELFGVEAPRIFTPPLRELHDGKRGPLGELLERRTTEGYRCIEFAENVMGVRLFPWQKWFLIHALELSERTGRFRFRTLLLLVGRQNGKSVLSIVMSLFFIYVLEKKLVLGTAQELDVAEEIWGAAVEIAEGVDVLADMVRKVDYTNGAKQLRLRNGCRYKVKAASRRAGRSLSAELVMLDELREHRNWEAWGAITKTTMAKADAIVLCLSNAGDATSVVLRHLRDMAHKALGDPDNRFKRDEALDHIPEEVNERLDPNAVAIFEWSAPPNADRWDTAAWAQANPSVGWNPDFTTTAIESAASTDPEWVFRTEVLCQWTDGNLTGIFPSGSWDEGKDPDSLIHPDSPIVMGIDMSADRAIVRIVAAGLRYDGAVHVEVVAQRAGTDWVLPWITDEKHPLRLTYRYVGQTNGAPVSTLMADLAEATDVEGASLGIKVVEWKGDELARGHGRFFDAVTRKITDPRTGELTVACPTVYHRPTATLDTAAAAAKSRSMGDGWVVDRKGSPVDPSSLVAAIAAHWLLTQPAEPVVRSAYEDHGLEVV